MIVRLTGLKNGIYYEKTIPHHKCTEEEYAEFYPLESDSAAIHDYIKSAGGYNCIDWDD